MLKKIFITFSAVLLGLAILFYVFVMQPYIVLEEVRVSDKPETVAAVYVNITGEPYCTKLYRVASNKGKKTADMNKPLFPALPVDIPAPDDDSHAYHDNVFILIGFSYKIVVKNLITGDEKARRSPRFDVTAWKLAPPYTKWTNRQNQAGEILTEQGNELLEFGTKVDTSNNSKFDLKNYVDCNI